MANDIDGYDVLGVIASKPDLFAEIRADVTKAARALMAKQLKSKTLTLEKIKTVFALLKSENFSKILDGLKDAEIKNLAKKIDKNNVDLALASASESRKLLMALASGSVTPAQKQAATPKASGRKVPGPKMPSKRKVTRAISSEAMAARWDGTNPDDPKK